MELTVILIFSLLLTCACCSTQNIRAAWIAHIQCPDELSCKQIFQSLSKFKINRIYICVWNNGRVFFNSSTMKKDIGTSAVGPDLLSWALKYSKEFGIPEVYAWFEYGLMASYKTLDTPFAKYARYRNWILGIYNNFWYLNPKTQAVRFIGQILKEAAENYPEVKGLQLDDHFDCPHNFSICNTQVMLEAAKIVRRNVRNSSKVLMSLSPMPLPNSIKLSNVDWPLMLSLKYFDEVAPQYYTTSFEVFKNKIEENEKLLTKNMRDVMVLGIRVNGSGPLTEWEEIEKMLNYSKKKKYGIVIWYSRGVFLDYPNQFKKYWNIKY